MDTITQAWNYIAEMNLYVAVVLATFAALVALYLLAKTLEGLGVLGRSFMAGWRGAAKQPEDQNP